nr:MAG TPA: hypothetical protein [Caudoviricetes sp.]
MDTRRRLAKINENPLTRKGELVRGFSAPPSSIHRSL